MLSGVLNTIEIPTNASLVIIKVRAASMITVCLLLTLHICMFRVSSMMLLWCLQCQHKVHHAGGRPVPVVVPDQAVLHHIGDCRALGIAVIAQLHSDTPVIDPVLDRQGLPLVYISRVTEPHFS
jgi:hypothetical protein